MKFFTLLLLVMTHFTNAPKVFSLDEMLDISLCKNASCFKKAALAAGYTYTTTLKSPKDKAYSFINYEDKVKNGNGLKNQMAWKTETTRQGVIHSVNFVFNGDREMDALAVEIDKRKYAQVTTRNKGNMLTPTFESNAYYRKGNTGILINFHEIKTASGGTGTAYAISIVNPCTPNWPLDL